MPFFPFQPLELREAFPEKSTKFDILMVFEASKKVLEIAYAMEEGRRVCRDIAGSDPERMAAARICDYLKKEFHGSPNVEIKVEEVNDKQHAYPLMAAVNRAASGNCKISTNLCRN